jgi:hypothetical protein
MLIVSEAAPSETVESFTPGEYRLTLTYRRNNRQHDQGPVLSEAGNSDSEVVRMDIP